MDREQAKQAIKEGKKITHEYFSNNEFVTKDKEEGYILFEDGVKQNESEFWLMRSQKEWQEGWSLFIDKKSQSLQELAVEIAEKSLKQAKELEKFHHAVVKIWYPTNYLVKMQPYVNLIIAYKKKHKTKNNLEAAIALSVQSDINKRIMILATGVEMTKNETTKQNDSEGTGN